MNPVEMKVLWTLLGSACLSLLLSCSKDHQPETRPFEMTFDGIETLSPMQVFTEGGRTIDPETNPTNVQHFLEEQYNGVSEDRMIFYNAAFREPRAEDYQNASFRFDGKGKVKYAADIIAEEQYDDATVMISTVSNAVEDVPIVTSDLFKYPYAVHDNGRYNYQYVVHQVNEKALNVSLLYYKLVRYDEEGNRTQLAWGTVHNEWNESFVQTLNKRDTLAIQTYQLKYSVKE